MALDFLQLTDNKLAREFNAQPSKDPTPARRAKVLAAMQEALAQAKSKEDNPKRGLFSTKSGVAKATIRLGSRPLTVQGTSEFFVPRERLADFYTQAIKSAEAGELDGAIRALMDKDEPKEKAVRAPRTPRDANAPKRTMSPEHKDKIAAARRKMTLEEYREWKAKQG